LTDRAEERFHFIKAGLVTHSGIDHLNERASTSHTHQGASRDEVGEVKRRDAQLFGGLHYRRCANGQLRLELVHGSQVLL
jgi:hypothetical protein